MFGGGFQASDEIWSSPIARVSSSSELLDLLRDRGSVGFVRGSPPAGDDVERDDEQCPKRWEGNRLLGFMSAKLCVNCAE